MQRFASICVIGLAACSGDQPPESAVVSDSAGVSIAEFTPVNWSRPTPWRLTAERLLSVGSVDGDRPYQFYRVEAVRRARDGRLLVLDNSSGEIRVFSKEGHFLQLIGRKGRGPGEFRDPAELWISRGDSLIVWERPSGPFTVFDPSGAYVRTQSTDRAALMQLLGAPRTIGMPNPVEDGGLIVPAQHMGTADEIPNSVRFRPTYDVQLVNADLSRTISFGTFGGPTQQWETLDGERTAILMPFTPHFKIAADARNGRIAIGNGDLYEIQVFEFDGTLEQVIRRPVRPTGQAVSAEDIADERERWMAGADPEWRQQLAREFEMAFKPEFVPAHDRLLFDHTGNLWVQEYRMPADTLVRWTVFGPDGAYRAHLATGVNLAIEEIGEDYVAGVERNEHDVERVVVYGLEKRIE